MTFTGCPYFCAAGYYGNTATETAFQCSGRCLGAYCEEGTAVPNPCPLGTYLPDDVSGLTEQSCIPCAPGTFSNQTGYVSSSGCIICPPGSLSEDLRATQCDSCPPGGYCPSSGASSLRQTFIPCSAGSYNPIAGASSIASCVNCVRGKASPIHGSNNVTDCRDCMPGSFSSQLGTAACTQCAAGTFQDAEGATACNECTP
eukprot:512478-Prymnesium_polylepis.1